jgi:ABC-type glycerol-3-phosphate transport system substrate-binding protein
VKSNAAAGLVIACMLLAGCATTQALADAPVEFWQTAEKLVLAVGQDLETLLLLLLGLV